MRLRLSGRTKTLGCTILTLFCLVAALSNTASAKIVRVVISKKESPAFGGAFFGAAGQYEELIGTAYGEINPNNPHNKIIQDISVAPRDSHGMVEYSMDICILRPIDARKGNGVLFYGVVNRGNKLAFAWYNVGASASNVLPDTMAAAGDGFLMSRGYTIVWAGWQGDLLPGNDRMRIRVPTLTRAELGAAATAMLDSELIVNARTTTINLSSGAFTGMIHASYPTASLDTQKATLTWRKHPLDAPKPIASNQWAFADCTAKPFPGTPSTTKICLKTGFAPNRIYDLHYMATAPKVLGLGFASTRDFISYLRYAPQGRSLIGLRPSDSSGVRAAIMYGASQSGRYIRTYVDLGFNADEKGRIVFDGMIPQLATGRIPLNVRWGQPGRAYGEYEDHFYPVMEDPLTWENEYDPIQKEQTGSLLDRCTASRTCPKIMQEVTATEYWQGRMSLDTTDPLGKKDLPIPPNVRIYFFSSTEHAPARYLPSLGICQQLSNPAPYREFLRDLLVRMTAWILTGEAPPPSRYAMLKNGTLVPPKDTGFPKIPGVNYAGLVDGYQALNFGPAFRDADDSGVEAPAKLISGETYPVLVPKVDKDGNDIAGLRSTTIQAPLGTYTGWNLRAAGHAKGQLCGLQGSYIPFAKTRAQRLADGDPRLSLQERYENHAGYVAAVKKAAKRLVSEGYLLPEDAQRLVREAQASSVLR